MIGQESTPTYNRISLANSIHTHANQILDITFGLFLLEARVKSN